MASTKYVLVGQTQLNADHIAQAMADFQILFEGDLRPRLEIVDMTLLDNRALAKAAYRLCWQDPKLRGIEITEYVIGEGYEQ